MRPLLAGRTGLARFILTGGVRPDPIAATGCAPTVFVDDLADGDRINRPPGRVAATRWTIRTASDASIGLRARRDLVEAFSLRLCDPVNRWGTIQIEPRFRPLRVRELAVSIRSYIRAHRDFESLEFLVVSACAAVLRATAGPLCSIQGFLGRLAATKHVGFDVSRRLALRSARL